MQFTPKPRECAREGCKTSFTPQRMGQVVCSQFCAGRWSKAQTKAKQTAERADFKRRREAIKTIAELIAAAQVEFNAYIRARDAHKGCFVCLRPFDQSIKGRALHAGHVRSRGAAGHLRFDEDNCMGECEGCNGPHGAKPHEIKAGAIARIGAERFAELENSNTPHKWQRDNLIEIRATYKAKRKALERETA